MLLPSEKKKEGEREGREEKKRAPTYEQAQAIKNARTRKVQTQIIEEVSVQQLNFFRKVQSG